MKRISIVVGTLALVLGAFAAAMFYYQNQKGQERTETAKTNSASLVQFHSPSMGPADAKVTIVEFFDPSCEACRSFYPYVKSILAENPQKVRLVLRYAAFHQGSDVVVKMLEAAKIQGLYWQSLEAVLKAQPEWAQHGNPQVERVWDFLKDVQLDVDKAKRDMENPRLDAILKQDAQDIALLQVNKTPTFFVNGKPLLANSPDALRAMVLQEIKASYP